MNCTLAVKSFSYPWLSTLVSTTFACNSDWIVKRTLRTVVHGTELLVFLNGKLYFDTAVPAISGGPGIGANNYGAAISTLKFGHIATG